MSQEELAFNLKISQSKLSKIESGAIKNITFLMVQKLCKIFNVKFEYFIIPIHKKKAMSGGVIHKNMFRGVTFSVQPTV